MGSEGIKMEFGVPMPSLPPPSLPLLLGGGSAPVVVDLISDESSGSICSGNGVEEDATSPASPKTHKKRRTNLPSPSGKLETRVVLANPTDPNESADLPEDFLEPLSTEEDGLGIDPSDLEFTSPLVPLGAGANANNDRPSRQFWKAGEYEGSITSHVPLGGGMDHVRVHPKFLHSNATSHKWALGAVAELLDNAVDEIINGATYVNVDMIRNPRDGNPMLLIEDDGGGMNPDRMRQCMSLGYSAKTKSSNTIGQYGNGFKTSTMRLGADVIVFSQCSSRDGASPTQSIGILSYTFLRDTGQEDTIVPMIDHEIEPFGLRKLIRTNIEDWNRNLETITKWSPYATEADLLAQFAGMKNKGTKVIVYNLWEDDQGELELDFDTDPHDIQVRGANRDEKKISMAQRFPNSKHFLTYRHSLRSYVSILYLRLPKRFKINLRGREVKHHSLVDDLMFTQQITYKPQGGLEASQKDNHIMVVVSVGFVKDAKEHIDVQGFNIYHKNRLIKPFWRIWNSASSQGRGIIGVLEANFVEPAHDKQGFERTAVLARLESRLLQMQKTYWNKNCHKVGYVNSALKKDGRPPSKASVSVREERTPERVNHAVQESDDRERQLRQRTLERVNHAVRESDDRERQRQQKTLALNGPLIRPQAQPMQALGYHSDSTSRHTSIRGKEANTSFETATSHLPETEDIVPTVSQQISPAPTSIAAKNDNLQLQAKDLAKRKAPESALPLMCAQPLKKAVTDERSRTLSSTKEPAHEPDSGCINAVEPNCVEEQTVSLGRVTELEEKILLETEINKNKQLEIQIADCERQIEIIQRKMEHVEKDRDRLKNQLEEERRTRELSDEELRKKLKDALARVKELEAENDVLRRA